MKYKLIKEYPGSPKLGNTIDNLENDWIENYPEFWEEVVKKNYEILSFIYKEWRIAQLSYFTCENNFTGNDIWKIYSVKRLSDGEIFTIGDKTNFGLISKIVINNNSLSFYFEQKSCGYNLQTLIKWKPLFTTEDGVDIFAGMSFYYVCEELELYNTICCTDEKKYKNAKQFSTKEKAEEYILMNKPCLSYGDVQEYLKVKDCNKVLNLVQSKIQQSV